MLYVAHQCGTMFHVFNLYGPCGNGALADDLTAMTLDMARSLGIVPIIIIGDFSLNLDNHELSHIMQWAGWEDTCQDLGPTCKGSAGTETNIDNALGTNISGYGQTTSILWDSGIATHALLNISLKDGPATKGLKIRPAPKYMLLATKGN